MTVLLVVPDSHARNRVRTGVHRPQYLVLMASKSKTETVAHKLIHDASKELTKAIDYAQSGTNPEHLVVHTLCDVDIQERNVQEILAGAARDKAWIPVVMHPTKWTPEKFKTALSIGMKKAVSETSGSKKDVLALDAFVEELYDTGIASMRTVLESFAQAAKNDNTGVVILIGAADKLGKYLKRIVSAARAYQKSALPAIIVMTAETDIRYDIQYQSGYLSRGLFTILEREWT